MDEDGAAGNGRDGSGPVDPGAGGDAEVVGVLLDDLLGTLGPLLVSRGHGGLDNAHAVLCLGLDGLAV